MNKRLLALLLTVLTVALPACAAGGDPAETTAAPAVTTVPAETAPAETTLHDAVPADLRYDGKTVTILQRTGTKKEMMAEEITGEVVNDAIYARNAAVEERLGIKFNFVDVQGTNTTFGNMSAAITNSINAQNDDYQIIANYAYYGISLFTQGIYRDLNVIDHLDFAQPWWNQDYRDEAEVKGKLYYMVGDICTSATERLPVCFINRDLAKTYYPDVDFYDVVARGKWTLDYQKEVAANAYRDLDGNGQILANGEGDGFGLVVTRRAVPLDAMMVAFGVTTTTKNAEGEVSIAMNNELNLNKVQAISDLYYSTDGVISTDTNAQTMEKLVAGETIFAYGMLQYAPNYLRNVDFSYGIMPLPKYNEAQQAYYTTPHDEYSTLSVPVTVADPDMVGAVLEVMAYESYKTVRPALFENAYKLRYLEDEASAQMFDFILGGVLYDFGFIYSNCIANPVHTFRYYVQDQQKVNLATKVKTMEKATQNSLEKFMLKIDELG